MTKVSKKVDHIAHVSPNLDLSRNILETGCIRPAPQPLTYCETHNAVASYLGLETFCGSLRGQYFIFGALGPSKSGLMNKHIVKHIKQTYRTNEQTYRETYRDLRETVRDLDTLVFNDTPFGNISWFHFWRPVLPI